MTAKWAFCYKVFATNSPLQEQIPWLLWENFLKINTRVLYKIFDKYLLTLYVCVYMFVCIFWCSLHVCVLMSYISLSLSYHWQANTRGVQFTSINRRQTRIGESRVESPAACFIISLLLAFIDIRVSFTCIFWICRFMVFFFFFFFPSYPNFIDT